MTGSRQFASVLWISVNIRHTFGDAADQPTVAYPIGSSGEADSHGRQEHGQHRGKRPQASTSSTEPALMGGASGTKKEPRTDTTVRGMISGVRNHYASLIRCALPVSDLRHMEPVRVCDPAREFRIQRVTEKKLPRTCARGSLLRLGRRFGHARIHYHQAKAPSAARFGGRAEISQTTKTAGQTADAWQHKAALAVASNLVTAACSTSDRAPSRPNSWRVIRTAILGKNAQERWTGDMSASSPSGAIGPVGQGDRQTG
jgi:hypothetical protein